MARVYISSTYKDLKVEREKASLSIKRRGHEPIGMEAYFARDERPLDRCLKDVRTCQAYVGIIGWRYGYIPTDQGNGSVRVDQRKSITHLEYQEAIEAKIPRLLFFLDTDPPDEKTLNAEEKKDQKMVKAFRKKLGNERLASFFSNPYQLGWDVSDAISDELGNEGLLKKDLVFYSTNRVPQKDGLTAAFRNRPLKRPLLCIIHGYEQECHDMFLNRLAKEIIPEMLGDQTRKKRASDTSDDVGIDRFKLDWKKTNPKDKKRWQNQLELDLSDTLCGYVKSDVSPEEINKAMSKMVPTMIVTKLPAHTWQQKDAERLKAWLEFWDGFPDLKTRQPLFIFFTMKYLNIDKFSWWQRGKKRKAEQRRQKIGEFLSSIFSKYPNVKGITLKELRRVDRGAAKSWVEDYGEDLRIPRNSSCDSETLQVDIDEMYDKKGKEALPMLDLAQELKRIVDRC